MTTVQRVAVFVAVVIVTGALGYGFAPFRTTARVPYGNIFDQKTRPERVRCGPALTGADSRRLANDRASRFVIAEACAEAGDDRTQVVVLASGFGVIVGAAAFFLFRSKRDTT